MRELFDRALAGDASAQESIAETIRRIARAVCTRGGPGGATEDWEDVSQEANRRFFSVAINQQRKPGSEESYLFAIVHSTFLKALRAASRRRDRELHSASQPTELPNPDLQIDVRWILARLSDECANLLDRVYLHGDSYSALAAELDILESSVRTRVSRCLKRAKRLAEGDEPS